MPRIPPCVSLASPHWTLPGVSFGSYLPKTAWFVLGRLREACRGDLGKLRGTVEVDEAYIGGKEGAKHASKKLRQRRGAVGKEVLLGMRGRGGRTLAKRIGSPDKRTLTREIRRAAPSTPRSTRATQASAGGTSTGASTTAGASTSAPTTSTPTA